ncbi:hypothetical protein DVDV_0090 [Desulfovibrio sp. DV]|nr:hypothetical protein DVDV_0090 [Desulfovibrio sp. DV]
MARSWQYPGSNNLLSFPFLKSRTVGQDDMVCSEPSTAFLDGITCRGPDVLAHPSIQSPRPFPPPGQSNAGCPGQCPMSWSPSRFVAPP